MKETAMLIEQVKVGDVLTVRGSGYLDNMVTDYTVIRVTKTMIICVIPKHRNGAEYKIDRRGVKLPKDKYINFYVTHVNGVKYPNE